MAITAVDKIKINKYLREHALGDIYYQDMCDAIGKRDKIKDQEFVEYFTDCVANEFRKEEKISVKQVTKFIVTINTFLGWMKKEGTEINEDILAKIRSFEEFYNEYLNRTGFDKDYDLLDNYIKPVVSIVNKLYPSEVKGESVAKYINKIAELNDCIKDLKKQLKETTRLYNSLQDSYNQKSKDLNELNIKFSALNNDIRSKDKESVKLSDTIDSLNAKILELESDLAGLKEENNSLSIYKNQYDILTIEVEKLKSIVEEEIAIKKNASDTKERQVQIESLIYQKILFERSNIDDIIKYIEKNGIVSTKEEVADLLKKMRTKLCIDSSTFSINPSYKINKPFVPENGKFIIDIPSDCQYYDIMLAADFHIRNFDDKILGGFDRLGEYCAKHGINLVLNLGDFFHGTEKNHFAYANAVKNYKVVEEAIDVIPKMDGLYHGILGGNHEEGISKYGFDPIGFLASEREDIINLGYNHSNVVLQGVNGVLGNFGIHHPGGFDFPLDVDDYANGFDKVDEYLNRIYGAQGKSRNDSYIDVFGHTHRNQMNYPGAYYYLGSFFGSGPCHLRIYFDEGTQIKYMVFIPLNSKMIKNNEIIYQKVLTK